MDQKKAVRVRIGKKLKELRCSKNMSQNDMKEALSLQSSGHVSLIESGERGLPNDKLINAAKLFEVHPSVFFIESELSLEKIHIFSLVEKLMEAKKKPIGYKSFKVLLEALVEEIE